MRDPAALIKTIIYLNAGMFIISVLFSPGGLNISGNPLTLLSPDSQGLLLFGATGTIPIDRMHRLVDPAFGQLSSRRYSAHFV